MHLRLKPYDFREFRIFHAIESAMLWALLVTCLAQCWLFMSHNAWIFTDASKSRSSNVKIRDFLCTLLVVMFHLRFFALMLYGVFGKYLRRTQLWERFFGGHVLKFDKDGINAEGLNDSAK